MPMRGLLLGFGNRPHSTQCPCTNTPTTLYSVLYNHILVSKGLLALPELCLPSTASPVCVISWLDIQAAGSEKVETRREDNQLYGVVHRMYGNSYNISAHLKLNRHC
jgi:hypothetical protein